MSKLSNQILNNISKKVILGNSSMKLKNLASDMLHAKGDKVSRIAEGCFLSQGTVQRILDCEPEYRPQAETVERCLVYCGVQLKADIVDIKAKYSNQPKVDSDA